jgi:hypothetical protein
MFTKGFLRRIALRTGPRRIADASSRFAKISSADTHVPCPSRSEIASPWNRYGQDQGFTPDLPDFDLPVERLREGVPDDGPEDRGKREEAEEGVDADAARIAISHFLYEGNDRNAAIEAIRHPPAAFV